ncbi:MAG: AmmeMemoRadiSam system protein B, partial [Nitrospirae bacterium]
NAANPAVPRGDLIVAFAPHAGYIYSGGVAAYTYKAVKTRKIKRIILLGPSHHSLFKGVSVYREGYMKTPLGMLEIDDGLAGSLINEEKDARFYPDAFRKEHSLEVQLPFIQEALGRVKIVPILVGMLTKDSFDFITHRLTEILRSDSQTILIVSTDLSHYHSYEKAREMDNLVIEDILNLSVEALERDLRSKRGEMCGSYPAIIGLSVARMLGATHGVLLKYANSGDTAGRKDSVVGYASIVILKSNLTPEERATLLNLARETVKSYVKTGRVPEPEISDRRLLANGAAFVTLYKRGHRLRGCIGNIIPVMPLYKSVIRNAVAAATRDPRFRPVEPEELDEIDVEVTVLSPLERISDISEIIIGRHGLYIEKEGRSGILLPQVATEFHWTKEEFLRAVSEKAGLPPDAWKTATLYRFTAEIIN